MKIIRKKISLEDSRSRVNGLLPFIPYNTDVEGKDWKRTINLGNWGGFASDLGIVKTITSTAITTSYKALILGTITDINGKWEGDGNRICTVTMMSRYNKILSILRNTVLIERKQDLMCSTATTGDTYIKSITQDNKEDVIRKYVPYDSAWFRKTGNEYINKYTTVSDRYISLVPMDKYEEYCILGGIGFIKSVDRLINGSLLSKTDYDFLVPYINVELFLSQDTSDVGILTSADEYASAITSSEKWENFKEGTIVAESKLQTLMIEQNMSDTDTLPGVFQEYADDEYVKITCNGTGRTIVVQKITGLTCGDGKSIFDLKNTEYLSVSLVNTAINMLYGITSGNYWFKVTYKNNKDFPMLIPYEELVVFNSMVVDSDNDVYMGDYIKAIVINTTEKTIEFTYIIGGRFTTGATSIIPISETGIMYREKYPYSEKESLKTVMDGYDATIYYNKIDYNANKKLVYSSEFNLNRYAIISNIIGYKIEDNSKEEIQAGCFKEDYLMGLQFPVVSNIDVGIDRGSATAFESHFKLAECNSLEDMENYSNGFFNV